MTSICYPRENQIEMRLKQLRTYHAYDMLQNNRHWADWDISFVQEVKPVYRDRYNNVRRINSIVYTPREIILKGVWVQCNWGNHCFILRNNKKNYLAIQEILQKQGKINQ